MNGWRGLNMGSNQEESTILNKNALLWLLAYSPKSRGGRLLFSRSIFSFGFLETCCHSSRHDFVGIQTRCEPRCYFCSAAEIIPVLRNSPHSYEISVFSSRMKTALLTSFRFYITCPRRVSERDLHPKLGNDHI
jgi:hypothetical protein